MAESLLYASLLAGCGPKPVCEFPDAATDPDGVIDETDTCGFWLVYLSDPDRPPHLYVDLHVSRELPDCALSLGPSLTLPNDPIYSALSNDSMKYTYDIVPTAAVEASPVDIACDEGTEWHALVTAE